MKAATVHATVEQLTKTMHARDYFPKMGRSTQSAEARLSALRVLQRAEARYLEVSGWRRRSGRDGLWVDPLHGEQAHIQRIAAMVQQKRDNNG